MNRFLKTLLCVVFFGALAVPTLFFFGAREDFVHLYGWEKKATPQPLTLENFKTRKFQDAFVETFSKQFFLRRTFLKTAYQLREWTNFGLFHYGYNQSIMEGKDEFLFERPYSQFHLRCPRPAGKGKYEKVLVLLKEIDAYCTSIGADFVFATVPDKQQLYPEYLPWWHQWLWDYTNYDVQCEMASICTEAGIKVYDGCRHMLSTKPNWEHCVFPPAGAHYNAYGSGLLYEGFLDAFEKMGGRELKRNRFVGVRRIKEMWSVDDDIGNLLNVWYNPRMDRNVHYAPVFEQTNVTMNAGSVILMGDCYREQVAKIFSDARLFDPKKILIAKRRTDQKPEGLLPAAGDLRLFMLVYQSFNSGRLDERYEEIAHIFHALKKARERQSKAAKCHVRADGPKLVNFLIQPKAALRRGYELSLETCF